MLRLRLIAAIVLALAVGTASGAWFGWRYAAQCYLRSQQVRIKAMIAHLDPSLVHSNTPNGRERFLQAGEFVLGRIDWTLPRQLFSRQTFYFRLSPHGNPEGDGWVEQEPDGTWMIKTW